MPAFSILKVRGRKMNNPAFVAMTRHYITVHLINLPCMNALGHFCHVVCLFVKVNYELMAVLGDDLGVEVSDVARGD